VALGIAVLLLGWGHFSVRRRAAKSVGDKLAAGVSDRQRQNYLAAFAKNSTWWRSLFRNRPVGWTRRSRTGLYGVRQDVKRYIQELNDSYANPSGQETAAATQGEGESARGEGESDSA